MSSLRPDAKKKAISVQESIPPENVLSLRERMWTININPQKIKDFFSTHIRVIGMASIVLILIIIGSLSFKTQANVAVFYPKSCLGGWENVAGAQGEPDVKDSKDATSFTKDNSAFLSSSNAELFCGHWTGDIPKDTSPKKFVIKLAWSVDDGSIVHEESQSVSPGEDTSAEPVLDIPLGPAPAVIEGPDSPSESPSVEEEKTPEEPAVETPSSNTGDEVSLFQFFARVHAQESSEESGDATPPSEPELIPETTDAPEESVSETPSEETEEITQPENSDEEQSEVTSESESENSGDTEVAPVPVIDEEPADAFMEVRYTLDGDKWETLGMVERGEWQNAQFEIPAAKIPTWHDIENVQISLTPIQSIDKNPIVYVDAISINVEYEDLIELVEPPKIMLKDASLLFDGQTDFTGTDTPVFVITDPGFTTDDINQLVAEDKAEIVEDKAGVLEAEAPKEEKTDDTPSILEPLKDILNTEEKTEPIVPEVEEEKSQPDNSFQETVTSFLAPLIARAQEPEPSALSAVILDAFGHHTDITVTITTIVVDGQERQQITINQPEREFRPGRYTLQISLQTPQVFIITNQDFTWGVLAINIDKSMYLAGDEANIAMGVLDDKGNTICDADLVLDITKPNGGTIILSTEDGTIIDDDACGPNNLIEVPDYHSIITLPNETGTYHMTLTATTDNGVRSITDQFDVVSNTAFDVRRTGPTRINPVHQYPMTMYITAKEDWSGKVTETVPKSFEITPPANSIPYESVEEENGVKVITWNLDLVAGEESVIGYYLKAPPISPEFYFLGPLAFYDDATDTKLFQEKREWQIASDLVCTSQVTTGNWNTIGTWSCGRVPIAGDDVVIRSTDTITMDVNSAVLATITINGVLNTSNGTARSLSGTTLTIGSTGTLTANSSTITLSGTTAPIVTFTSGATFTVGTSTVTLTGNADMTAPIVGTNSFYNLTFGPTTTTTRTYTLGSDPLVVTNNLMVRPVAGSGGLTVNMGASVTVTATTNVTRSGSVVGILDTTSNNYTFSTGIMTWSSSCIFKANASTINVTGIATLFTTIDATSFDAGTSTVNVSTTSAVAFNSGTALTVYNLTFSGATGIRRIGAGVTVNNALTVTGGGTLNGNGSTVTGSGTNTLTVTGSVIQVTTSTFAGTFASFETVTLDSTSTVDYNLNGSQTIDNTLSYANLTASVGGTKTLGGNTTATGRLTVTLGTVDTDNTNNYSLSVGKISIANSASAILNLRASAVSVTATSGTLITRGTNGVFTSGTSTVTLSGNGSATVNSGTFSTTNAFNNLTSSGTGTKTLAAAITINSNLSVTAGTFDHAAFAVTGTGTNVLSVSNATITVTLATFATSYVTFETITLGAASTVDYNRTNTQTVDNTLSYVNLTISGSNTKTLGGATTATGVTTVSAGTLDTSNASNYALNTATLVVSGGTLTTRASAVAITGTSGTLFTFSSGTFTAGTSTFTLSGNGTATVNSGSPAFYNLINSGTGTKTLGGDITVSNVLTLSAGTFAASSFGITLSGTTGTPFVNNATFSPGTGTVSYTGNNAGGNTTIASSAPYYNLTINNASETYVLNGTTTVDPLGVTTVTAGTLDTVSGSNYALSTGTMNVAGTFLINNSTVTLTATSGTLFTRSGTFTLGGTSTVTMNGNGNATINSGTVTFDTLTSTGTGIKSVGASAITINKDLTVSNGTFNPNATTVTGTGTNVLTVTNATLQVDATTFAGSYSSFETRTLSTGSIVDYNRNGAQTIDNTVTYVNLKSTIGGTKSLGGATTATGTITISTSTIDTTAANGYAINAANMTIDSDGTLLGNASVITLSGNWSNAGTFTAGTSEVKFNTASTATIGGGPTTFYKLTITHTAAKEVDFSTNALHIITVTNAFSVTGSTGNLIKLYSGSSGSKWHFKPTGSALVNYADIKDGGCESGAITISPTNSTNSGNNDSCWSFFTPLVTFSISDNAIGFGTLSSVAARYATGDAVGSSSEVESHQITANTNATSGYSIYVNGTTLTSGANTISAIGSSNTASSPGTPQFGLRMTATGGSGAVVAPYAASGFALDAASFPSKVAGASSGDSVTTTYSVRYLSNISGTTKPGAYTANLIYTIVPNF